MTAWRLLRPRRTIWPTRDGWWCLAAASALGVAGMNTGNNLLYLLFAMLLGFIIISGFLSEQAHRGLAIRRTIPEAVHAGEECQRMRMIRVVIQDPAHGPERGIVLALFGGGLRERDRLVFAIESSYVPSQQGGLVSITARLDPNNLDRAEASIRDVIKRVRDEGVTEAERERAVITAESHYAFDIETAEGLARTYGQGETTWTLENELQYLQRLRKVTRAEIQAMARKYFGDESYARVRFVPRGGTR